MKKNLSALLISLVVLSSIVLALNFSVSTIPELTRAINSTSFTITNNEAETMNFTITIPSIISDGEGNNVNINSPLIRSFSLGTGNSTTQTISYSSADEDLDLGKYSILINILAVNAANSTIQEQRNITLTFNQDWCEEGTIGKTKVLDIRDLSSDDDFEWKPLDEVEIEVKVTQDTGEDIDTVVRLDLYDTVDKEFIGVDGDGDELEEEVSIDDGKSETVDFTLKVPAEVEESSGRYVLYARVFEDGNEEEQCGQRTENIKIERESREVKLTNVEVPESVSCGGTATINLEVANIGSSNEKKIKVQLINTELGLDETKEISNLDWDDDTEEISFSFEIPEDATEKTYPLKFNVYFKYDSSNDKYSITNTALLTQNLKVEGNCKEVEDVSQNADISASLQSEANAGQEIVIKATIKNTGSQSTSYTILTSGTEAFGVLESINPQTFTISAGESKDVLISLKANDDASGDYTFTIRALFVSKTKDQPVSLTIQPKAGFGLTGSAIGQNIQKNWFIWLVVLINIILIILIIVVAARLAKG